MRLGLCGAQRVGKTTLAREFAKTSGLQFVPTNTRQVMKRLGADPTIHYPIRERLEIQQEILTELCSQWEGSDNCLFDRTPLDVLAYMEADVLRDFPNDFVLHDQYLKYRERCLTAAEKFNHIVLVQPGIPIVDEEGAALGSIPYMEHFNTLCLGYIHHLSLCTNIEGWVMHRGILSLEARVRFLDTLVGDTQHPTC